MTYDLRWQAHHAHTRTQAQPVGSGRVLEPAEALLSSVSATLT
jgi:hypothetical protein